MSIDRTTPAPLASASAERWALWRAKGDAHDQRVRQRVERTLVLAGALAALGGAVVLTLR